MDKLWTNCSYWRGQIVDKYKICPRIECGQKVVCGQIVDRLICPQIIGGHKVVCVQIVSEQACTKCGHMRGQIMDKSIIRAWTNSGQIQIMDKLWTKSGLWANCGQTPSIALTNDYFVHNLSTPTSYLSRICPHLHGQIVDKQYFVHNLHIVLTVVWLASLL